MSRRLSVGLLALIAGCSAARAPHHQAARQAADSAPPAPSLPAAPQPSGDWTASGAAGPGPSLSADLPDDGRILFDGDRSRGALGYTTVSGSYGDDARKWLALRGQMSPARGAGVRYSAPPAPDAAAGSGPRPGAAVPAVGAGRVFEPSEYQRFQQALYTTIYPVLSRLDWGARRRRGGPIPMTPYRITVHHTEGHQTRSASATKAEVRGIQSFHMGPERGWDDIAYHFLIDGQGRIAEGRPTNVLGAHAKGANDGNIGIALLGNFDVEQPTGPQLDSLERLSSFLAVKYDIPVLQDGRFEPHRHYDQTSCPGKNMASRIPTERVKIGQEVTALLQNGTGTRTSALASFTPVVVTHHA